MFTELKLCCLRDIKVFPLDELDTEMHNKKFTFYITIYHFKKTIITTKIK